MNRWFSLGLCVLSLSACIGDLPQEEFPCLVDEDLYNKYNEAYVFSPQGDKKRQAMDIVREAELRCKAAASSGQDLH